MRARRLQFLSVSVLMLGCLNWSPLAAQSAPGSQLPALAPTGSNLTAPLAAVATSADRPGEHPHAARVRCDGGLLEVRAENSSLNGILRAISRCTGMRITGGVPEQRVFGNYGPAAPATVLATLIDGTDSNMVLRETARDQPAELILTPRTGGATPPPPSSYADAENDTAAPSGPAALPSRSMPMARPVPMAQPGQMPPAQPDALPTPSTTPSTSGIVDAPNPPPAGSDTAAALNGAPAGTPGTTNISPDANSQTTTPGATNTTLPANTTPQQGTPAAPGTLTPEQIFQQLQQRQQQRQQQQQQQNNPQ